MEFVMCRQSLARNKHFAEGALGGCESFIQKAGLTIAFCGSYVNPFLLDAADGTHGELWGRPEAATALWGRPV